MDQLEREQFAATIKGISLDEQRRQKQTAKTRNPVDDFVAWQERFMHELTSEFGPLPELSIDDAHAGDKALEDYIKNMKKKFRLRLK
jgi:hypothetical protein